MNCFCYLHIFPNDKIYVGTTQQEKVEYRWKCDGNGYKRQPLVWRAIQKYGWENIRHKVIECETPEEMWEMEKELIKEYDTTNPDKGYNCSTGGEVGPIGCKHTEEFRKKMSELHKDKHPSNDTRKKMSESAKNRPPMSDETIRKISEAAKNRPPISNDTRKKMSESAKNRPPITEEHRIKISEALTGKKRGSYTKYKWLTPSGEIKEMTTNCVSHWHKDWILIQNQ